MPRTKLPSGSVTTTITLRLPRQTHKRLAEKARREKLSLAEFIRRALRREIETSRRRASRDDR
jgi:predicted HicB family RNase H-like nuclease